MDAPAVAQKQAAPGQVLDGAERRDTVLRDGRQYVRSVTRRWLLTLAALALSAAACADAEDAPIADVVRLNEIQVLGSHNSYHGPVTPAILDLVTQFDEPTGTGLDYSHPSIGEQLEDEGARQLELDVWADPDGGLYADRRGNELIGAPVASGEPVLDEPGFKVLHAADIDFNSTCLTFVACLEEVKAWSDDHPTHLPIMILVEAKYTPTPDPVNLGFVDPPDFTPELFTALDDEIRTVFDADHMILPAEHADGGWPTLDDARGKVLFALDNDDLTDVYGGEILFTARTGFAKLNDPIGDADRIAAALARGDLVRTRADAETIQSRENDPTQRDAALASGAQFVSSDYLVADTRFSDYVVALPSGAVARCNPVVAPDCDVDQLNE
jgi:hypothetical protein